jgi:hypothetical protein
MSAYGARGRASGRARNSTPAPGGHAHDGSGCAVCDRLATGEPITMQEALALMTGSGAPLVWDDEDDA